MAPPTKKSRLSKVSSEKVLIRLCDAFTRTDGDIICPIIKAENSVRVLYKLQEKDLQNIVHEAGAGNRLTDPKFLWKSAATDRRSESNLFIEYSAELFSETNLMAYQVTLAEKLKDSLKVKDILIDKVQNTEDIIPQPIISEIDFEVHKLELCHKELAKLDELDIKDTFDAIIREFKEQRTKFAFLSQNGKGKSFFLNLLLLMTSDNKEEYRENNRKLILPKNISGDQTVQDVLQSKDHFDNLPDVIKSFIRSNKKNESSKSFITLMRDICQELQFDDAQELEEANASLRRIPAYFSQEKKFPMEPYILAQKSIESYYDSTTKCNIRLRYGTVYQLKVEYFSAKELQIQLFELVSLRRNETGNTTDTSKKTKQSFKFFKAKFAALTSYDISEKNMDCLQSITSYEDIVLSEKVKQFAEKTLLYIGGGKELAKDRLALKKILRGLTSSQDEDHNDKNTYNCRVAAIKEIVVYIPSKILYNKEIMEMPGSDNSDSLSMHFIEDALDQVDGVFFMSECSFKLAEQEVKKILRRSEFMKAWKKNPELYALMLLTYPEKDSNYQFRKEDVVKMKILETKENDRRSTELEELKNLLHPDSDSDSDSDFDFGSESDLSDTLDKSVFSTYVLPILHTSIQAQEGKPHKVLTDNAEFLKYTGIHNLIIKLDTFISTRAPEYSSEVKVLSVLNERPCRQLNPDEAKTIVNLYKKKDHEKLLDPMMIQLTEMYETTLYKKVEELLENTVEDAKDRWEKSENKIRMEMLNPLYRNKGTLSKIIFGDLESHKETFFKILMQEIQKPLDRYKQGLTELLTRELKEVFEYNELEHINSEAFVKETIEDSLTEALNWYKGKQRNALVVKKISECWEKSKKKSLTENILEPAYKLKQLEHAKKEVKENIRIAILRIADHLTDELSVLHDKRWKSISSHLTAKNGLPQMWNILILRLKSISKNGKDGVAQALSNVKTLVSVPYSM
ncbi:uncharacterized protein LOC108719589 isoform X2 [Xenopus laevis]|uniref:Uncharacterized protein LOC108719589 isoform X2 n=1 Tax=Xenopus laevis TaxID=8355 RepID=A0A8J1MSW6_XENLA|nr:uncharacterized protein LOC108719589 isoform X2 [Xenopus laevis]